MTLQMQWMFRLELACATRACVCFFSHTHTSSIISLTWNKYILFHVTLFDTQCIRFSLHSMFLIFVFPRFSTIFLSFLTYVSPSTFSHHLMLPFLYPGRFFSVPRDLCSLPPFFPSIFLTSNRVEILQDGNWNDRMDIIPCFPSYFPQLAEMLVAIYGIIGAKFLATSDAEVYSSELLEIVSTFLSRGFRSLKLRFLLSKEIFFLPIRVFEHGKEKKK